MADPKFDESRPFGTCYGDTTASYYQNGHHFDANKQYLPAVGTLPNHATDHAKAKAEEIASRPDEGELNRAVSKSAPPAPAPEQEPAQEEEVRERLMNLKLDQLKEMVKGRGGKPPVSKTKCVNWLIADAKNELQKG